MPTCHFLFLQVLEHGQSGGNGQSATHLGQVATSSDLAIATMLPRLLPAMATQLKRLHAQMPLRLTSMTKSSPTTKNTSTVYCCHTNNTIELATCGLGVSCAGNCSALGATLCPSGNCTGDCAYSFEEEETTEAESGSSVATKPSSAFKWCSQWEHHCNVWRTKGCCYNPVCRDKTSDHKWACRWLNYLTGD